MKLIEKKIKPLYFNQILDGDKSWEIRNIEDSTYCKDEFTDVDKGYNLGLWKSIKIIDDYFKEE